VLDEKPSHTMTDKQKENWVSWEEVQIQKKLLNDAVKEFASKKTLTEKEYDTLLSNVILSLYTDINPRRNQDYSDMYVVKAFPEDNTKNYLSLDEKKFQFNKFKTAKTHGSTTIDVPEELMTAITAYLKHHPLNKGRVSKKTCFQFLVKQDGTPINPVNGITRVLNKIFGKKIGSSMLRHIFLSSVYGDKVKELEGVAKGMGHTSTTQAGYVLDEQIDE
jgi:integrase